MQKILALYHPNRNNTGFACSFSQGKDGTIFAGIIKQSGWDDAKKTGSFLASRNDPLKNTNIKLAQVEVAAILDCVERNRSFSTLHDGEKQQKSIQFVPWFNKPTTAGEKPVQKGFSFSISVTDKQDSTTKNAFYIGITFPEGRLIRAYLDNALNKSFENAEVVESEGI
jgi:hypothetical protein